MDYRLMMTDAAVGVFALVQMRLVKLMGKAVVKEFLTFDTHAERAIEMRIFSAG